MFNKGGLKHHYIISRHIVQAQWIDMEGIAVDRGKITSPSMM